VSDLSKIQSTEPHYYFGSLLYENSHKNFRRIDVVIDINM